MVEHFLFFKIMIWTVAEPFHVRGPLGSFKKNIVRDWKDYKEIDCMGKSREFPDQWEGCGVCCYLYIRSRWSGITKCTLIPGEVAIPKWTYSNSISLSTRKVFIYDQMDQDKILHRIQIIRLD